MQAESLGKQRSVSVYREKRTGSLRVRQAASVLDLHLFIPRSSCCQWNCLVALAYFEGSSVW